MDAIVQWVIQNTLVISIGLVFVGTVVAIIMAVFGKVQFRTVAIIAVGSVIFLNIALWFARDVYSLTQGGESVVQEWVNARLTDMFAPESGGGNILDSIIMPLPLLWLIHAGAVNLYQRFTIWTAR